MQHVLTRDPYQRLGDAARGQPRRDVAPRELDHGTELPAALHLLVIDIYLIYCIYLPLA